MLEQDRDNFTVTPQKFKFHCGHILRNITLGEVLVWGIVAEHEGNVSSALKDGQVENRFSEKDTEWMLLQPWKELASRLGDLIPCLGDEQVAKSPCMAHNLCKGSQASFWHTCVLIAKGYRHSRTFISDKALSSGSEQAV